MQLMTKSLLKIWIRKFSKGMTAVLVFLFVCASCVEPFTPDIENPEFYLVIDGIITDQAGLQTISVSRTVEYTKKTFAGVGNCVVQVIDERGDIISFNENREGVYSAFFNEEMLAIDKIYMLRVITPDGEIYESGAESFVECPDIDSVWVKIEENRSTELEAISNGYQVYLSTKENPTEKPINLRWELESTWEYHAHLIPDFVVEKPTSTVIEGGIERAVSGRERDATRICWIAESLNETYTNTTSEQNGSTIKGQALNFVSFSDPYVKYGYSLLVKQYSLSSAAFEYYDAIYKMSTSTGSLYESQPYMVTGNIDCISNSDKIVLGYFSSSGIREKRIYIDPPDEEVYEVKCNPYPVDANRKSDLTGKSLNQLPVYGNYVYGQLYTADKICYNCLHTGGTNVKPAYWKE